MKLLVALWVLLSLIFPIYLLFARRFNISLAFFYSIVCIEIVADVSGNGLLLWSMPFEVIVFGVFGFAIVSGVEYSIRRDYVMAAASSLILVQLGAALYIAASLGAFA